MTRRDAFRDCSRKIKGEKQSASIGLLWLLRAFRLFRLKSVMFFVMAVYTYSLQIRYVESPFPSFGRLDRLYMMYLNGQTAAAFTSPRVILHVSSRQHAPRLRAIKAHILRIAPRIICFIRPGFYFSFSGFSRRHDNRQTVGAILRGIRAGLTAFIAEFQYHGLSLQIKRACAAPAQRKPSTKGGGPAKRHMSFAPSRDNISLLLCRWPYKRIIGQTCPTF